MAHQVGESPVPGYKLTAWLGTGSYGEVWQADGPGGVSCALKFISLDSKSGLKELRAVGLVKRLQHPNLVPVQAIWLKDRDGQFLSDTETESDIVRMAGTKILIIAMGLGHKSLAQRLEECRGKGEPGIPVKELLRYMDQAAEGIDYLNEPIHDIGQGPAAIIHCDIKPANLLIVGGGLQICDYGVAKALGQDIRKTLAAGTPAYAPAELINNEPGPKTDQYSLAMSYFELRTGKFPFPEEKAILSNLLGHHDLSALQKDEIEIVRRALHMQPNKRFATCRELVDELKLALGSLSGGSRPPSTVNPQGSNPGGRDSSPYHLAVPKHEGSRAAAPTPDLPPAPAVPPADASAEDATRTAVVAPAGPADTVAPADRSSPPAPPAADVLPAELKYKLIRLLGRGNFGEVYEAEAPGGFRVAIKRILRAVDHPNSQGELASLEAIKTVAHPFLLQTQAYWVFENQLVIAMELAEGSLQERIDECKKADEVGVPARELVRYFEQVAQALDYLHSLNITHRDIKPQNLLYLKGYAKVADFGLARVQRHTQTTLGTLSGTPHYMAPEVWGNRVSLHSDQYSLAATYVMARLGRPVFKVQAVHELAQSHIDETPDLAPLSGPEASVLLKALAKKPDDRYPSCGAFVTALRDAVFQTPPSPSPPLPVPARRSRWPAALLAGAVAVVLAVVAVVAGRNSGSPALTGSPPDPERCWQPPGWEPENNRDAVDTPDGKRYYRRLTRTVGEQRVVAVLVPREKPSDPPSFYMLTNKVTNQNYRTVWDAASNNPGSRLSIFRQAIRTRAKDLLPNVWPDGAIDLDGTPLGSIDGQADVPVVNVTVPEAMLVAEELGGKLPTYDQWAKAVGVGDDSRPSTAGAGPFELGTDAPNALALNLKKGPWRVSRPTPDVSVHRVHQLVSNGYEWTRDASGKPLTLFPPPAGAPQVLVVGQTWESKTVMTFDVIADGTKNLKVWDDKTNAVGFRLVLEPE